MRFLTSAIERAGRDAGPHHIWWWRASVPAIFTCMKAHWYNIERTFGLGEGQSGRASHCNNAIRGRGQLLTNKKYANKIRCYLCIADLLRYCRNAIAQPVAHHLPP